jgi:hypothetical protein
MAGENPPTSLPTDDCAGREPTKVDAAATVRTRRRVLTAGVAGLAGLALGALGGPGEAEAAAGSSLIIGSSANNEGSAGTTLTSSGTGTALRVTQNGTGTALAGVTASGTGYGVLGQNTGAASTAGAVRAAGGNNHGVVATTANKARYAVTAGNSAAAAGTGAAMLASGGQNIGLVATTASGSSYAIRATNNGAYPGGMGGPVAIWGEADDDHGHAIIGQAPGGVGVTGLSDSGTGIEGDSGSGYGVTGNADTGTGVFAQSGSGTAVLANAGDGMALDAESGNGIAVYGHSKFAYGVYALSNNGPALYSDGNAVVDGSLTVTGSIDKSGGTFKIDHPQDPAGKYLQHSFVESPDMKNVYDGSATLGADGQATVTLPRYFDALNRDARVQLTAVGRFSPLYLKDAVVDGRFTIAGGVSGQQVFWQVTGIRRDPWAAANPIVVELAKQGAEHGLYLHPELYGQPTAKGTASRARVRIAKPAAKP